MLTEGDRSGPPEGFATSEEQAARLIREVARSRGGVTQRRIAAVLGISKRDARRCLVAAKRAGIVGETVEDNPSAPGRRLFWLTLDRGRRELDRLDRVERLR